MSVLLVDLVGEPTITWLVISRNAGRVTSLTALTGM